MGDEKSKKEIHPVLLPVIFAALGGLSWGGGYLAGFDSTAGQGLRMFAAVCLAIFFGVCGLAIPWVVTLVTIRKHRQRRNSD